MANKALEVYIRCPFYARETELSVGCEGIAPDTCMFTKFPDEKSKIRHIRVYCSHRDGGDCFLARALYVKYEEEDRKVQSRKKQKKK